MAAKRRKVVHLDSRRKVALRKPAYPWPRYLMLALIVLAPLVFSRWTFDQFDIAKLATTRLLTLAVLIVWLLRPLSEGNKLRLGKLDWLLLVFLGAALISTVLSVSFLTSLIGKYKRYEGLLTFFNYALIYFLAAQIFADSKGTTQLSKAVAGTGYLVAAYGVMQFLGADPVNWGSLPFEQRKAFSTFGNPDLLGGYLALVLPVALAEYLGAKEKTAVALRFLGIILVGAALTLTFTRGAWIGGLAGALLVGVLGRKGLRDNRDKLLLLATTALVGLVLAGLLSTRLGDGSLDLLGRFKSITRITEGSAGSRLEIWKSGLAMIRDRPVFGFGPDTFRLMSERYETKRYVIMTGATTVADNAHNYPIQVGAGAGLIALFSLLAFWAYWLALSLPGDKNDKQAGIDWTRVGIYSGVVAYLVHLLFGISVVGSSAVFWTMLGAMTGSSAAALTVEPTGALSPKGFRGVMAAALLAPTLLMSAYGILNLQGDYYFARAVGYATGGQLADAVRMVDMAASRYPGNSRYFGEVGRYTLSYAGSMNLTGIDQAISLFKKAREHEPMEVDNQVFLGVTYAARFRFSGKEEDLSLSNRYLSQALLSRPYSAPALYSLATNYLEQNQFRRALAELKRLESVAPNYQQTPNLLSRAYYGLGETEQAEKYLRKSGQR